MGQIKNIKLHIVTDIKQLISQMLICQRCPFVLTDDTDSTAAALDVEIYQALETRHGKPLINAWFFSGISVYSRNPSENPSKNQWGNILRNCSERSIVGKYSKKLLEKIYRKILLVDMETIPERRQPYMESPPSTACTNSYKLEPDEDRRFSVIESRNLLENVLKERLEGFEYDPACAGDVCKNIVTDVTGKAKTLRCDRYRFVSHAAMFTNFGQTVKAVSRFLWD